MKKCNSCGNTLSDSVRFCIHCGSSDFSPLADDNTAEDNTVSDEIVAEVNVEPMPNVTDLLDQPVPVAPTPEIDVPTVPVEPVYMPEADITPEAETPVENQVQVATPITPPPAETPVQNIPGDVRSFMIRDRIRKLAASKLAGTFEVVAGIQFVVLLVALAAFCIVYRETDIFNIILTVSIIAILPYFFQFIESSVTHSSAKKAEKKFTSAGVVFGTMANLIFTIYAGITFIAALVLLVMGNTGINYIRQLLHSGLPVSYDYSGALDILLMSAGLKYGLTVILLVPFVITGLWFWSYILIDVAHTRTVGAIKCESIRKTPVVLPSIAMIIASLLIIAAVVIPMVTSSVISLALPVKTTAAAIAVFIIGIALCALWAVGFFVKGILLMRLRACFRK